MSDFISQMEIARIANVMPTTLRRNVRVLLKMVLQNGYSIRIDIVEKLNRANLKVCK